MDKQENEKYVIVKLSELKLIEQFISQEVIPRDFGYVEGNRMASLLEPLMPALKRFKEETGADMQTIARGLKQTPICAACIGESMEYTCQSIWTHKAGRRLQRLIDRANYIVKEPQQ